MMTSLHFLLLLLATTSGISVTSYGHRRRVEPSSRVVDVADPCKAGELLDRLMDVALGGGVV